MAPSPGWFAADGATTPRVHAAPRRSTALVGPLDGYRGGAAARTPVRVSNLTPAGCLIESLEPEAVGVRMTLEILLPDDGWIQVDAEVSSILDGCGYVMSFPELPADTRSRIARAIEQC